MTDAAEVITRLIETVRSVHVSDEVRRYVVDLVTATRRHPDLRLGASPRATLHLIRTARAAAALEGRPFVVPDDVQALAPVVLPHRLLPTPRPSSSRRTTTDVVARAAAPGPPAGDLLPDPALEARALTAGPDRAGAGAPSRGTSTTRLGGLRTSLSGLTIRGRSLIAAGLACLVLGRRARRGGPAPGRRPAAGPPARRRRGARRAPGSSCPAPAPCTPAGSAPARRCSVDLRIENLSRRPTPALFAEDIVAGRPRHEPRVGRVGLRAPLRAGPADRREQPHPELHAATAAPRPLRTRAAGRAAV